MARPTVDDVGPLKEKLLRCESFNEMMLQMHADPIARRLLCHMTGTVFMSEVYSMDTTSGPLADFPPDINKNVYCEIVRLALAKAPLTLELLYRFVVKQEEATQNTHVIKIATLFANICHTANPTMNAAVWLRSLALKMNGLTDRGVDQLACHDLAMTSRSLDRMANTMSAVGSLLHKNLATSMSAQSCWDNLDVASAGVNEHLTLGFHVFEDRDSTKMLSTTPLGIEETLQLFSIDTVTITRNSHQEEWHHLVHEVLGVGVGNLLVQLLPETAGKLLKKHLPRRHACATTGKQLSPARIVVEPPYPFCETLNSDMVRLCLRRQKDFLGRVARWKKNCPSFMADMKLLEDTKVDRMTREEAEVRVKEACREYGENISHGDLLTVQKQHDAKVIMAGSTTAFGRLEYLGHMRLGMMHLKMKKLCIDIGALMPNVANFEDRGGLAYLAQLTEKTFFSNKKDEIKKDDSTFEKHDQFVAAVAGQALANMYVNWVKERPDMAEGVKDKESAVEYVLQMLHHYGVLDLLTYDPERRAAEEARTGEDDLFSYYREMVARFLPSLAIDLCEEEGDCVGLLAVQRLMVCYMLGSNLKSQNVKYADYTLFDVVKVLSSSERSRQRMAENCTINVSGTKSGGLFWDKVCEHQVRAVKGALRRQHGNALDDILIEKVGAAPALA